MWELTVDTKDLEAYFKRKEKELEAKIPDLFSRFAETLSDRAEVAFEQEGYPIKWVPSAAALEEKRKTLQDTGRLKRSFEKDNNENFFQIIGDAMYWGSMTPYGPYLTDEDYLNPRFPLREVIVEDNLLKEDLEEDMRDWAQEWLDA